MQSHLRNLLRLSNHSPPPLQLLLVAGLIYLGLFFLSIHFLLDQPWLGVTLETTGEEILVTRLDQRTSDTTLDGIKSLKAIHCSGGELSIETFALIQDPEEIADFRQHRRFFVLQDRLHDCLQASSIALHFADGDSIGITPLPHRPFDSVPVGFWLIHAIGVFCYLFGIGVWAYKRGQAAHRLLVIGAMSIALVVPTMAVYGFRELALDGELFLLLHRINRFSVLLLFNTTLCLLWYYPRPINHFPFAPWVLSIALLTWLNETLQIVDLPLHSHYLLPSLTLLTAVIISCIQWWRSRDNPADRAALLWFLLSILVSNGAAVLLYAGPTMFGLLPVIPLWVGQGLILLMFFGLALGVARYRLFDIERWWFATWLWFIGALLVLALDIAFITLFNLQSVSAFSMALLIVAWGYLPLRNWLWQRIFQRKTQTLEAILPRFLEATFTAESGVGFERQWPQFLQRVYNCLAVENDPRPLEQASLSDNGVTMHLPNIDAGGGLILSGRDKGRRLFSHTDLRLARGLLDLARRTTLARKAAEQGAARERKRIMRDLHDDVGAQLLGLVHLAESDKTAGIARSALKSLRETVYSLKEDYSIALMTSMHDWREEMEQRLKAAGVALHWRIGDLPPERKLSPRQHINLGSILREAVTNALKHAEPTSIEVQCELADCILSMTIFDDGITDAPETWSPGAGMVNMKTRAREIDAALSWIRSETRDGARTAVCVNLHL